MKAGIKKELEKLVRAYSISQSSEASYSRARIVKREMVDEAKKYLSSYKTLVLLDVTGVPARFGLHIRRRLNGVCTVKMFKGKLLGLAMKELNLRNADELSKYLVGQNLAVFTNMNSFEIALLLNRISMPIKAKIGEKVDSEIRIPPMKTDLKPGPIMSLFGKLKVPIQVSDGVISITKESVIARPGDIITPELASLFARLGIEPKFIKPTIKVVYEEGLILTPDKLVVDIDGIKQELNRGVLDAFNLASELVVPHPDVVKLSITKAYNRAVRLAAEAGFMSKETAQSIVGIAVSRALAIAMALSQKVPDLLQQLPVKVAAQQQQSTAQQSQQQEASKPEEERKEVSEEQLAEGLSALFG
ncbi:MAG: 50S ribosomal protein L10 [Ignisphaera sp.]|nr:50S ribosomal protein L10 [Ignisphaera sp.]MCX8168325.1 50S ribosomal protein L10 [Ignisphaera sp.]MDW8085343.1 50S ribosomal protein L10 [Ignisphaera sp.]